MSSTIDTDTTSSGNFDSTITHTGRVKWFNNKAGYGFITICKSSDEERVGQDVFAHHSGIKVDSEQYKYLVQGEYVDFTLRKSDGGTHPFQAAELTGICSGKLMCETRWDARQARGDDEEENGRPPRHDEGRHGRRRRDSRDGRDRDGRDRGSRDSRRDSRQRVRSHGSGPRDEESDNWKMSEDDKIMSKKFRQSQ